jgi:hypothetical protein
LTTWSERERNQKDRRAKILLIVGDVENGKQIHLSDEERRVLVRGLEETGRPIEAIRQMGISVIRNPEYGRISLDLWLKATRLYTEEEIGQLIEQRIHDRLWLVKHLKVDEAKAKEIAETNVQLRYYNTFKDLVNKEADNVRARNKHARFWYAKQTDAVQLEIMHEAEKRDLLKPDPMCEKYRTSQYIVHLMLPVIEEKINQMPEGGTKAAT